MIKNSLAKPPDDTIYLLKRLLLLAWQYRTQSLKVIFYQSLLLLLSLTGLSLLGLGVDTIAHAIDPTRAKPNWPFTLSPPASWSTMKTLFFITGMMLTFGLLRSGLNFLYAMSVSKLVNQQIVVNLRQVIYAKLQTLSFRFFDDNASGAIINRLTSDVQNVRLFIDGVLLQGVIVALSMTAYLFYMFHLHFTLAIACLASAPLILTLSLLFSKYIRPYYARNRELADTMVSQISESIQGILVTKSFAREEEQKLTFTQSADAVRDQQRAIFWRVSLFGPSIDMLTQINLVILLSFGGYLVIKGELPLGTGLIVFSGLLQQFSAQVTTIVTLTNSIGQSLIGAKRVFEVLDTPIEIANQPSAEKLSHAKGKLHFEKVSFHYQAASPLLSEVSFTIKAGEKIGLFGATGSGKSSLLSLIPRFFDPTTGAIFLDDKNLKTLQLDDLRRQIGVVFQENFLFSNTIAANIAFGHPQATQAEIEVAAKIANAHNFIQRLPKGYQTILGESGLGLSGGQRQRLALARALLLQPSILLLDDPTAAVDPETEREILEALELATQGRTTLMVAHRISTLKRMDRIFILEKGSITHSGTHEELLRFPNTYQQVAALQQFKALPPS